MSKPNIVYIHSHDTGRYVQPYGYAVPTPNIQLLAEEGVLFRQAFCVGPTCSPSRVGLLTGQYPHCCGMFGLAHRGFQLDDYDRHLVKTLKNNGYYTALSGVQHEAPKSDMIGYHDILEKSGAVGRDVASAACNFLNNSPKSPFFLSVGFTETHRDACAEPSPFFNGSDNPDSRYCRPPSPVPDSQISRADMADFIASARSLDNAIGEVLNCLKKTGLDKNTLIICTTDHGVPFPGMKCTLTDHGTGVMLIIKGPEDFTGGKVIDAMVSQLDVFPAICDIAGISKPEWLQGSSLLPLVQGKVKKLHDRLFGEITYHAAYQPQRSIRTERWKYIRRFNPSAGCLANCDPSLSKDYLMEYGWHKQSIKTEELYDLILDPNEVNNLVDKHEYSEILCDMRKHLYDWMNQDIRDSLLDGTVPAPADALVSHPDDISPGQAHRRNLKQQMKSELQLN